jgi:uncharacterized protein YfaS (alpha-2-macroglobulin family)
MKSISFLLFFLFPVFLINAFAQEDYTKLWDKVTKLEQQGLPQSALSEVDLIYQKANQQSNSEQLLKTIIYKIKLNNYYQENQITIAIDSLTRNVGNSKPELDALMHVLIANLYSSYYQSNAWKISQRTPTGDFHEEDIDTWTSEDFNRAIVEQYQLALNNPEQLYNIPIKTFPELLNQDEYSEKIQPSLLDFIVHTSVNQLLEKRYYYDNFPNSQIENRLYLADARLFVHYDIDSSLDLRLKAALENLQLLMKYHIREKANYSAVYTDLVRLEVVHRFAAYDNKNQLLFDALSALHLKHKGQEALSEVDYRLVEWYYNKAESITHIPKDTTKAFYYQKAWDLCEIIINNWEGSRPAMQAKQQQEHLKFANFSFSMEDYVVGDQSFPIFIKYKNLKYLHFSIYKISPEDFQKNIRQYSGGKRVTQLIEQAELINKQIIELPGEKDFVEHSTEFIVEELKPDHYVLLLSDKELNDSAQVILYKAFYSTRLAWLANSEIKEDKIEFFVTDRINGNPLNGIAVEVLESKYNYKKGGYDSNVISSGTTNKEGRFCTNFHDKYNSISFRLNDGKEQINTSSFYFNEYSYYRHGNNADYRTNFFTDRAVYRPGQTVYLKGICTKSQNKAHELLKNYRSVVYFYDANYQLITEKSFETNEFGSFSMELEIPEGLLNGRLLIKEGNSQKYIRLEEYKRPSFEVKFDEFNGNYQIGKTVSVSGYAKALSGANISNATLNYQIMVEPQIHNYYRYYYFPVSSELLTSGTIKTDDEGKFEISFIAKPLSQYPKDQDISYRYSIVATVTDISGESRSASNSLSVGYRSLFLNTDWEEQMYVSELDSIEIFSSNINQRPISAQGNLKIYSLANPQKILNRKLSELPEYQMYTKQQWAEKLPNWEYENEFDIQNFPVREEILSINFNTQNATKYALNTSQLEPGVYKIELRAQDAFGLPVIENEYVTIRDLNKGKAMAHIPLKLHLEKKVAVYEPGETMQIYIESGVPDAYLFLSVKHENTSLYRNWIKINQKLENIPIEITEELRGGIGIYAFIIHNGRYYAETINVNVPFTNKTLDFEVLHFRDNVLPGSEEEIIFSIINSDSLPEKAEVLAAMYDASLDALYSNDFYFNLFYSTFPRFYFNNNAFNYSNSSTFFNQNRIQYHKIPGVIPNLNLFGLSYYGGYYSYGGARTMDSFDQTVSRSKMKMEAGEETHAIMADEDSGVVFDVEREQKSLEQTTSNNETDRIRQNFEETAFFLPHLYSDEEGKISFKFTLPESLTKWKFMALAHTQDLKSGLLDKIMTSSKKLMVVPNFPRFLREGDSLNLSVKISNLTDEVLQANCEIHFTDVLSGKDVTNKICQQAKLTFEVDANKNTSVKFKLFIPEGLQAVEYKVIAKSDQYGDGEQNILPVLSNRMLVTESMPMYVNGNSTKTWRFDKLLKSGGSESLTHHQLSLEATPRPAWYAIQALPYLMEYPYECSEQVFSRFYANSMAAYIANSDPKIQAIFNAWKNIPESKALQSNLQKNSDLKALMLEQTPWVMQAKDESERKRRVGLLFDMERMQREQLSSLSKLKQKQAASGGFPWFEGMPESRYITQHVLAGLGHLIKLNVLDGKYLSDVQQIMRSASQYLDAEIQKDYQQLKRFYKDDLNENHISYVHIHYLYARSFSLSLQPINRNYEEAYQYFFHQAEKYWNSFNYYSKAMIALSMYKTESSQIADNIMASLKEYAIVDEEMGMYWKNSHGYYWYEAPIETQALLIEAFNDISKDKESVERMKQWLLNQKRTQDWKTTKATSEAIYALILTGSDLLDLSAELTVEIGGKVYDPQNDMDNTTEAGTGYFRKDWHATEITPEMGEVKLTKSGDGMAWGALHWQYFEDMDKITSHETPLQLEKKIFKKKYTAKGAELELVTDKSLLRVGDQMVVRIILRTDRDMEFIHMKDMRASCFEPISTKSGYNYQDGLGYYQSIRDASVDFFFSWLGKGTYVFEYALYVTHAGEFSNGITTIQSMYAPEFNSHSEGVNLKIEE